MVSKDELIHWLEESHNNIEQLVSQIDQDQEIYPGWTIREALSFEHVYQELQHPHGQLKIAIYKLPSEKNGRAVCLPLRADQKRKRFCHQTHH
jgi:hypothetical protein